MAHKVKRAVLDVRNNIAKFFGMTKGHTEIILDGPAGTGKTRGILERQHLICCKYPNSRGLILRKFRSSMNETVLQVLDKEVFADREGTPYLDAPVWHERDQKYTYANGTEIVIAGMDDPTKVLSSQYDWAYWNECIEGARSQWETVMSRLRNFRIPYPQMLGDTNPGPPTHWINKMALDGKLCRLPTTHKDNPFYWDEKNQCWTPEGEIYVNTILRDSLTGISRKRLYDGIWVAAEGQVYPQWDEQIHVVPRRDIPKHWLRYWCFDFGMVDPFVWLELVEDPNTGQLILHRELYHTNMRVEDAAELIKKNSYGIVPYALICDHDAENRATLEKVFNFLTLPAFKLIHPGIQAVQSRLLTNMRWANGNNPRPGVVIMENANIKIDPDLVRRHKPTCTQKEWEGYVWDTGKQNLDKYKDQPVDKDNHGLDAIRYGICFVDSISIDPQQTEHFIEYNDLEEDELEEHFRMTSVSPF